MEMAVGMAVGMAVDMAIEIDCSRDCNAYRGEQWCAKYRLQLHGDWVLLCIPC